MAIIRILVQPASTYTVQGDGGAPVTMISVAMGAVALADAWFIVRNVAEAAAEAARVLENMRRVHGARAFSMRTYAIGRKMVGFDAARAQLNYDHVPAAPAVVAV